jgi:hypothetical protein
MNHEFKVNPQAYKELFKIILIRMISFAAMMVIVAFILPYWMAEGGETMSTIWLTLPLFLAVLVFTFFNSLKRQKAMLAGYRIIITEDSIIRELPNTPTITIHKSEVKEIVKQANGSFMIVADSKLNAIGVSAHMDKIEELEQFLSSIQPIKIKTSGMWLQKFQLPIGFLFAGLMFASFYITNRYLATFCGIIFIVAMGYSFIVLQKSKNVETRAKRMSYFVIFLVGLVILSIILKWK